MRRKLLTLFLFLIMAIFILDYFSVDFSKSGLDMYNLAGSEHEYIGKVVSYKKSDDKLSLTVDILKVDGSKYDSKGYVLVNIYDETLNGYDYIFKYFSFNSELSVPNERRNPHCFNYRKYLLGKNIFLTGTVSKITEVGDINNIFLKFIRFLHYRKEIYLNNFEKNTRGIISGVLFGDVSSLDDDIYESFRTNGTSHILCVSGLHIGLIYSVFEKLGKGKNRKAFNLLTIIALFIYGYLAMWGISIKRAILMIYLKIIAKNFDLRYDSLTALSMSGILLILFNPYVVFQNTFQLSYLAVLSINVISPMFYKIKNDNLKISLSVFLGMVGYQAYVFNYITPISIILNLPVILIATYLLPVALILYIINILIGNVAILNIVPGFMSNMLIKINNISLFNIKTSIDISSKYALIFIFISLFFLLINGEYLKIIRMRKDKIKIKRLIILMLSVFVISIFMTYDPITYSDIVFIDVGQGDAIHIRDGKLNVLIDGGGNINYNIGENTLKPYFLKNGVSHLNLSLLTHTHTDHYKAVTELNEIFKIDNMYLESIVNDTYKLDDDIYIRTLWPGDHEVSKDENENCSVFLIYYKGYKIMITGDLDSEGEKMLLATFTQDTLKCDILKVGHHGSSTSSSEEFLNVVSPKYAVIQVGKNNYGHPSEETIYKLNKIGAIILRNDLNGAIGFSFNNKIKVSTELDYGV